MDPRLRALERVLTPFTARVIAVADTKAMEYRQHFSGSAPIVIPNGVDLLRFHQRNYYSLNPLLFLAVSRIHPQKDLVTMVRGFSLAKSLIDSGAILRIVGPSSDDAYLEVLRREVAKVPRDRRVELVGESSTVAEHLTLCDVLLHTAVREAHPISILEASVVGTPIIGPNIAAVKKVVGHSATLFQAGDERGLARAIDDVVLNYGSAVARASASTAAARRRYSIEATASAYLRAIGV